MDSVLGAIDVGVRGFAILLTRWVNLGVGLGSIDATWQSHITVFLARDFHRPHNIGDIRAEFEG